MIKVIQHDYRKYATLQIIRHLECEWSLWMCSSQRENKLDLIGENTISI